MSDATTADREGDFTARRSLAKSISAIESGGPEALAIEQRALQQPAAAHVLGITGPPGAGKSSLISALLPHALDHYGAVAILAVDPSSSLTGGALLGDRVRMDYRHFDQKVFFRSMASRGYQGGIAAATRASVNVLDAAGWPLVIIETLGIGQVELDVMDLADRVAVVLNPGWGDSFQADKAGLTEQGDAFVLNKADRPGLENAKILLEQSLQCLPTATPPSVFTTIATDNEGISELWQALTKLMQDAPTTQQSKRRCDALREGAKTQLLQDFERFLESPAAASPENASSDDAADLLRRFYRQRD
jgi:LAO/AO transport system kinase